MGLPIPHSQTSNFYFPVQLAPIQAQVDERQVPANYQAIVRTDTHQVLGICRTGSYQPLANAEAFTSLEESLLASALDVTGMQVQDALSYDGGISIRTYIFPAHSQTIRVGDIVSLRLKCVNSFNLTSSFQIHISALRLMCLNGLVIPTRPLTRMTMRHSRRLDIKAMGQGLSDTLDVFVEHASQWRKWSTIRLSDQDVDRLVKTLPQVNPRLEERLRDRFVREVEDFGQPTLYGFFNALTAYATHGDVKASAKAHQAAIVLQRENKVRTVLNSPTWRQLARG